MYSPSSHLDPDGGGGRVPGASRELGRFTPSVGMQRDTAAAIPSHCISRDISTSSMLLPAAARASRTHGLGRATASRKPRVRCGMRTSPESAANWRDGPPWCSAQRLTAVNTVFSDATYGGDGQRGRRRGLDIPPLDLTKTA